MRNGKGSVRLPFNILSVIHDDESLAKKLSWIIVRLDIRTKMCAKYWNPTIGSMKTEWNLMRKYDRGKNIIFRKSRHKLFSGFVIMSVICFFVIIVDHWTDLVKCLSGTYWFIYTPRRARVDWYFLIKLLCCTCYCQTSWQCYFLFIDPSTDNTFEWMINNNNGPWFTCTPSTGVQFLLNSRAFLDILTFLSMIFVT